MIKFNRTSALLGMVSISIGLAMAASVTRAAGNLLNNPAFEDGTELKPWSVTTDSQEKSSVRTRGAHSGQHCLAIPARSSVEQHVENLPAGAYLARCWVKSELEQKVTLILSNPNRPWAAYNYAELKVPKDKWTLAEVFCALDEDGALTFTLGGMSKEFHAYHGPEAEMGGGILVDDCELLRYEPKTGPGLTLWDAKLPGDAGNSFTLPPDQQKVDPNNFGNFSGEPIFQSRHLIGQIRKSDGGLIIHAVQGESLQPRGIVLPSPGFKVGTVAVVAVVGGSGATGLRISSEDGATSYLASISPKGLISIVPQQGIDRFEIQQCRMSYGILPSFVGTDVCYAPAKMAGTRASFPSTQWFVGLVEGGNSMLVAVWNSPDQAVSMGLSGEGEKRVIDSLSIETKKGGFSLSFVEHAGIWHKEPLKEDYLGDYTTVAWQRPFEARWMGEFFVSPGGKRSFHEPYNDYSFPIASAKTRMWGVWFEDWNHYPFHFDGPDTVVHFEKSFAPSGDALIYFLEPAAADLYSPLEIVEQALGPEKASAFFDLDGNQLRKLSYSTPPLFMYDRPVCATTTRLSQIKQDEKPTVGVNLATHLYEFIREIRGRVDQYEAFFADLQGNLETEKKAHQEAGAYLSELESLVREAQARAKKVYDTPLSAVRARTDGMKELLQKGQGDGFNCGNLDVRGPAGEQDDLCRRYNRVVMHLEQVAALNCGDSPEKARIAKHIWDQSRAVLRRPTRWESRRTLYFFEP
ncbi:MAG TPA: hypothetical protein VGR78_14320 [Verrucomicrobiae bacterium]|nr:hypothetical protein [Verrucomicrobiae bacterium]